MVAISAKKSQPSRKGTKAWRKNIDITDVEEHLEQLRHEERTIGLPVAKQEDSQLFVIDRTGDEDVKRRIPNMRPLRIDQILGERTAIHALGRPHSNVSKKQPVSKATKVLVKKLAKSKSSSKSAGTVIDIWSAEPEVVGSPVADVIKEIVQPPPVKAPKTLKSLPPVATAIPAVELPHPGISYQPSEAEHQEAIELAAQTEIERLDKLQAAADSGPLKKIILAVQNLDAHATMDVDLPSEDEEENMKQEDHVFVKEEPKRKTKVERNRDKRRREAQLALQKSRERKALYQQIDLLPDITKKVEEDEKKREEDRRQREENAKQRQLQQPAQLSKYKYTPIPMAIQTTDEVVPSLRQLKPESNIFKERFNQMQKRNLIETRVPISLRRRYELKNIEKYSYKRFE